MKSKKNTSVTVTDGPVTIEEPKTSLPIGGIGRIIGSKSVVERLTKSDVNRLQHLLIGGNHRDRTEGKRWLAKNGLELKYNSQWEFGYSEKE